MDKNSTIQKLKREIMEANEINRAALSTYGAERQVRKCLEELSELGMAVSHCFDGKDKPSHVAEEIADVGIMLEQMAILFMCEDEVERMRRYKLRRLEQRVEEYKGKKNKPLTFEELKDMIGEPVWIVDKIKGGGCRWAIASESLLGLFAGYDAYRMKPREVIGNV